MLFIDEAVTDTGDANYKKAIYIALSVESCTIVIGSKPDYCEIEWVRYELDTYL